LEEHRRIARLEVRHDRFWRHIYDVRRKQYEKHDRQGQELESHADLACLASRPATREAKERVDKGHQVRTCYSTGSIIVFECAGSEQLA
jgi:hypothetical protein